MPVEATVVLAVVVVGAVLAVGVRDTLSATTALVVTSAALATYFYLLGAPYAAVFQAVLAAGLVPVLFLLTASLTPGKSLPWPTGAKALTLGGLAAAFLLSWAFLWARMRDGVRGGQAPFAPSFAESLWVAHAGDVLTVALLMFVGMLAVVRLTAEVLDAEEGSDAGETPADAAERPAEEATARPADEAAERPADDKTTRPDEEGVTP